MKRICFLLAAIVFLMVMPARVAAQDAEAVMDRYLKVSGFDKLTDNLADQSVMIEMNVKAGGIGMPIKGYIKYPDKMRIEMSMMGENVLMVLNGKKGWMVMAGTKQPLPAATVDQMAKQNDVMSNMKWDSSKFEMELLDQVTEDGKKLDVVKAIPKEKNLPVIEQVIYFNNADGMIVYVDAKIEAEGQSMDTRVVYGDYKTINGVRIPKSLVTIIGGVTAAEIDINTMEFNYPTADWMFAEPE